MCQRQMHHENSPQSFLHRVMKYCEVLLFAELTRALQDTNICKKTTSPTSVTILDPFNNLTGSQLLEFITVVEIMCFFSHHRQLGCGLVLDLGRFSDDDSLLS